MLVSQAILNVDDAKHEPVLDKVLKNDDFPTLGKPGDHCGWVVDGDKLFSKQTYDTDLQVVPRPAEEGLLLFLGCFLGGHDFFLLSVKGI